MLKIGLTGGIGTGKSIVAKVFDLLNVPVYVSDIEAKRLMNENTEIKKQLIAEFGSDVYVNHQLNREYLAKQIFADKKALEKVNRIVHPVVRKDFEFWASQQTSVYVIQESAILFDTGLYKNFDKIITVTAEQELRIKRVMERDAVDREQVEARMKNQISEEEKFKKSDFILYNNTELLLPQILKIDAEIRKIAQSC
jgi:dephospho-CoA kinase